MHSKSNITYLLNPAIQAKTSTKNCHTPDRTVNSTANTATMSLFRSLAPVSSQPATSSLQYRRQILAYIAPYEKKRNHIQYLNIQKAQVPLMTLVALSMTVSSKYNNSEASSAASSTSASVEVQSMEQSSTTAPSTQADKIRIRKTHAPPCEIEGCKNLVVSRGCCVRHGGGSRCTEPGCSKRAKLYQRCFQHGGFKTCTELGCTNKAKRYGRCWTHGGGHICEVPDCTKVSTQGGLCWAHGGGNRCKQEGCNRRSYQKYHYYCIRHAPRNSAKTNQTSTEASTSS